MISKTSIKAFYKFLIERETIRLKKENGDKFPWTNDRILQKYKFTNVKREHDKTSRLLRKEFYEPNKGNASMETVLLNCTIARYFGSIDFMRAIGWQNDFQPLKLKSIAKERLTNKQKVFTGAYIIANLGIKAPKHITVVDYIISPLWKNVSFLCEVVIGTQSWESLINAMRRDLVGFGGKGFMAKEVVLDTMFNDFWDGGKPKDFNDWCPCGPGARRGINRLINNPIKKSMSEEFALDFMKIIFNMRTLYWPKDYVKLELHDIQFQLCEFDKYLRVKNGEGRPRSLYKCK